MRMGTGNFIAAVTCGALAVGFLTTASAQQAASDVVTPQVEGGAPARADAVATYLRNALTVSDGLGHSAHIFPTVSAANGLKARVANPPGPLKYNGGQIMPTIQIYNIFWKPLTLQSGAAANMSAHYMFVANGLATDYAGHDISSNNTQYYQNISGVTYVSGLSTPGGGGGSYGGSYLDTNAYPASVCSDSATPKNCITDPQLQRELKRVMALNGWTGGLNKIYMIYTAQGEGSCFTASSGAANCAYTGYCAYHSSMMIGATPVIYANEPYGSAADCQAAGTPSPTGDVAADTAMTSASHEISEAITDPLVGTGWTDTAGYEIGDLCAYVYGANSYDKSKANQFWNGRYYELQEEWDNHAAACVQKGP